MFANLMLDRQFTHLQPDWITIGETNRNLVHWLPMITGEVQTLRGSG